MHWGQCFPSGTIDPSFYELIPSILLAYRFFLAINGAISILSPSPVFLFPEPEEWCGICATTLLCTSASEPGLKKDGFYSPLNALWIIRTGSWKGNNSRVWGKHNAHHEIFPTSGSWRLHLLKETPGSKWAWKYLSQHTDVQWGNHTGRCRHSVCCTTDWAKQWDGQCRALQHPQFDKLLSVTASPASPLQTDLDTNACNERGRDAEKEQHLDTSSSIGFPKGPVPFLELIGTGVH